MQRLAGSTEKRYLAAIKPFFAWAFDGVTLFARITKRTSAGGEVQLED